MEDPKAHLEPALEKVLLRFSEAAQTGSDSASLIGLFCRATREFFRVDGTYYWQVVSAEELVGTEADGWRADHFRGRRLALDDSALASEVVRQRRTLCGNHGDHPGDLLAHEFRAGSWMAVPVMASGEVLGAAVLVHASQVDFFHPGATAQATILAREFGSLLRAQRGSARPLAEQRSPALLSEVAQAVRVVPDTATVAEAIAEHLRSLLRTKLVAIVLRDQEHITLEAVAAESSELRSALRAGFRGKGLDFAGELVARAIAAGEVISLPLDPRVPLAADFAAAGALLAAPFRTSRAHGAIAVYPREDAFSPQEKSLLSAVSGFGAVAIANAELCRTARFEAAELEQLLDISCELSSLTRLDEFLEHLVRRATDFLGFGLGFVALLEDGTLRLRSTGKAGNRAAIDAALEGGIWTRAWAAKDVFTSEDRDELSATDFRWLTPSPVRQLLAVPLVGSNGQELGLLGVVDRLDGASISEGHLRAARALCAHIAVALESASSLDRAEHHQQRAESLVRLAWEWNRLLDLPNLARRFVAHAAQLMGAQAALVAVSGGGSWEILALDPTWERNQSFSPERLKVAIPRLVAGHGEAILSCRLEELLTKEPGPAASSQGTLVRLLAAGGELMGVLCLVRQKPLERAEEQLLQAISAHASIAFENARLFTRMEEANRRWVEVFDAISDLIVAHDESDNVLWVNRPLADFIGVEPKELIGVKTYALFALATGFTPRGCPFCRPISNGRQDQILAVLDRTYLVSTSQVHAEGRGSLETIHLLKDISDRREAERRYRELFDNTQEGVFVATADGGLVEVNDTLVRLLAYDSREQLLQTDIRDQVFSSRERYDEFAALMLEDGAVHNHEQTWRRRDGSPIPVLINAFAVRDADQRVTQYRGVILDLSGLKSSQSELQRERDFSAKILNNTQSLILVTDTAGLISYANRRWRELGYQPEQLWGRPLEELIAAPRRPALAEALAATSAGQPVDHLELQLVRGAGRLGHFSLNLSPMRDEQGNITNIVVVMSDITDAASLQAKLIHAEKMVAVGQLVSGVAHEVNNPLTAILGFADLLLENPEVPESARKDLRVILQEAQRTKQIVQNLLSFARPMPPQRKPIALNTILDRTVQLRAYDFHSRGVEILEHLEKDLHPVLGDSHQLQQVFLNILNNAYDAVRDTGRAARIEIRTMNLDNLVQVIFRDNGQGVEFPERIFDPFFTTKEIGKGTGLGLSICQGIVREHGGDILCHNNRDGEGATFIVRLPAVHESAAVRTAAGVAPP